MAGICLAADGFARQERRQVLRGSASTMGLDYQGAASRWWGRRPLPAEASFGYRLEVKRP